VLAEQWQGLVLYRVRLVFYGIQFLPVRYMGLA
jgi:hypothetical protein